MSGARPPSSRPFRLSRALYRRLLLLYPRAFRARFGESLEADFAELLAAERERGPLRGCAGAWGRASLDLLRSALRQHLDSWSGAGNGPIRRTRRSAPAVARRLRRGLVQDAHHAARALWRRPGSSLLAASLLALGIGPGVAVFALVDGVVLRPLPYRDSGRIVHLTRQTESGRRAMMSVPSLRRLEERVGLLERVAAFTTPAMTMHLGGRPRNVTAAYTDASLAAVLRTEPLLGSWLPDAPSDERVVVLSHELWTEAFAGDPTLLGSLIEIDGEEHRVLGIMPPGFGRELRARLWLPIPAAYRESEFGLFAGIGRIRSDAAFPALSDAVAAVGGGAIDPADPDSASVRAITLHEYVTGPARTALLLLLGAVAGLWLVACANVANLVLVRVAGRRREIATRAALGAGRARLARQLGLEALMLSAAGGAVALAAAWTSLDGLMALIPHDVPRLHEVRVDGAELRFACLATLLPGLVIGLLQIGALGRGGSFAVMRSDAGAAGGSGQPRLRRLLSVVQVGLSVLLLVGAGLFARSFVHLVRTELGFATAGILDVEVWLDGSRYETEGQLAVAFEQILDEVAAVPGVESVAYAGGMMPRGAYWLTNPDTEAGPESDEKMARITATAGYFRQMAIPVLEGRGLSPIDRADSVPVVVVSEAAARALWPGDGALGKRLRLSTESPWLEVVGVVGTVRQDGPRREVIPQLYVPLAQSPQSWGHLLVAARGDAADLADSVRQAIWRQVPEVPLDRVSTLDAIVAAETAEQRFQMTLLAAYASTALVLAAIGLAGMLGYSVTTRRREIGVRVALGASARRVQSSILRDGLVTLLQGAVLGVAVALSLGRLVSGLLFAVPAWDPWTYGAAVACTCAVGLLAAWVPARRASRIDPVQSLRAE